ncbi:cation:proton antiporter [Psychrobium sp. nBUS_13]|uniref:cation:proton antiporter domain-containing protein n=1 Tax=Psychrobium sp. nBUS_13 TaxID=3395319 RepID=UPI003EB82FB7
MLSVLISLLLVILVLLSFRRLKIPPVLGYLVTGILVGPSVFELLADSEQMHFLAEMGVVFLLFSLGLEFSLPKLMSMKGLVFGLGSAQLAITTAIVAGVCLAVGLDVEQALIVGVVIALSSTAIVIKQLSEMRQTNSGSGQMAISVLLFQDIAVVPVLILIPMLGTDSDFGLSLLLALGKGVGAFIIIFLAGKLILPKLFDEIARARSDELFVLTAIMVVVFTGALTYSLGLSAALGAFLSGMMLGESKYRHQLDADIRPFKDILMGLFFVSIGMMLNLSLLVDQWTLLLICLPMLILAKSAIVALIYFNRRAKRRSALKSGFYLAQVGEFGFVVLALAQKNALLSDATVSLIIALGVLSMAMTPILMHKADALAKHLIKSHELLDKPLPTPTTCELMKDHVVICGFGRVGQTIARFLKKEAIAYIAMDQDPVRIQEAIVGGEKVLFGDSRHRDILKNCHVDKAKLVVITFDDNHSVIQVLSACKEMGQDIEVMIRTRDDTDMSMLKEAGAQTVVPEALEGSLMLVSQVLFLSGVPMSRVLKRIQIERKNQYKFMHGYFHGDESSHNMELDLEQLHAVAVPLDAHVIGHLVGNLPLERLRITLRGIRRNHEEISEPDDDFTIKEDDVLILCGKPRRVERAERYLLNGG